MIVAVILLQTSVTLGVVVLVGVPVLTLLVGPLLKPLQVRSAHQRELTGSLSNTANDIVAGLRVLRGIGGERVFHDRYTRESQSTRRAGVEVARLQSVLDALQVFLPGVFVVLVVWLGARYAVEGQISPGELVAFYGYSAFLMIPLRTATEYANKLIRAHVAAQRVCRVLSLDHRPPRSRRAGAVAAGRVAAARPPHGAGGAPGFARRDRRREPGRVGRPRRAARSGRTAGRPGRAARRRSAGHATRAEVRRRVVVSDSGAALFSGTLGERLDVSGHGDLGRAVDTSSAEDILDGLPEGLDTWVAEKGRTFSGGQRQRLVLARALALDPEVLVLVEPTSAVDAHTEARIAARLADHRAGRITVLTSSSPLVLAAVDEVAFLQQGRIVATGRHEDLLDEVPDYRMVVHRESEAVPS